MVFAAIQCKFYGARHRIQKADIDSFISASGKAPFVRRVVIDTTEVPWGANAEEMITGQSIPVVRLSLTHLRESPIDWTIFGIRGEAVLSAKKSLGRTRSKPWKPCVPDLPKRIAAS